jgi:hypothetical protein
MGGSPQGVGSEENQASRIRRAAPQGAVLLWTHSVLWKEAR